MWVNVQWEETMSSLTVASGIARMRGPWHFMGMPDLS